MIEVSLTYPTPDGSQVIPVSGGQVSFGRGSDADRRFTDDGLSRLHATIYRDGDRVWIVDENSSNGTFVNGERVSGSGTPLKNGDSITIGNNTKLNVRITHVAEPAARSRSVLAASTGSTGRPPYALIGIAAGVLLLLAASAIFVGFKVSGGKRTAAVERNDAYDDREDRPVKSKEPKETPVKDKTDKTGDKPADESIAPDQPSTGKTTSSYAMPAGKKYADLSDTEKRTYLADRAMAIAQVIGNRNSEPIPPAALDKIKGFVDAYARRLNTKRNGGCRSFGDDLQVTYERASKNAPFIVRAFNEKGTDPRIGLYLAMIESEHCVCLQSPTGPLGMFQFTYATAKLHFTPSDGVIKGASPSNPDDRCKPEPSARAAASYMKALTGRYGTGPSSVPLAIGSYNSGEGGLSTNLQKALETNTGLPRDFWTLIANGDILSKQFQMENFKYVPKFFAAAIIGENPADFGLNLRPISTYTN